MLRRHRQVQAKLSKIADALLFCFAFWLTHLVRSLPFFDPGNLIHPFSHYAPLLLVIFVFTPPVLELHAFYQRPVLGSRGQMAWALFKASAWITLLCVTIITLLRADLARGVVFSFGAMAFVLVTLKEELFRSWALSRLGNQALQKRILIVGVESESRRIADSIAADSGREVIIAGRFDLRTSTIDHLANQLHEHSINAVVISPRDLLFSDIESAIRTCEIEGVEVWLRADFFQTQISQTTVDELYGHPMLVFRTGPDSTWQAVAKTILDFTVSLLLLVALFLPLILVAALVKLTSAGPIFFRQKRAGLNGAPFTMLKFRTMVTNAEQLKQELASLNEMTGPVFKITNDPRVTPIGRFLRKWSIDELPQIVNILRGEMSLVGPRPLPLDEVRRFDDVAHRRRLSVKPGLTCLWQVSGRNNVSDFKEWVRLDLEYIDNWSFWLDLKILWRTIPAVFSGAGAK